jgi:hypothetical protein
MRSSVLVVVCMLAGCGSGSGGDGPGGDDADAAPGGNVECESNADCPADAPLCDGNVCTPGCAAAAVEADLVARPSDIIWIVDQSGSMDQETSHVQQKINDFATLIDASGIDYRVVMIADPGADNAICVPPPLAGPACGDNDRFRLVPSEVDSNDGPELSVTEYPLYQDFLRAGAAKHLVFVTDDNSDWSADQLTAELLALAPDGMFTGFEVHGIYAFGTPGGEGCDGPFGSGAAEGTVYTELIADTGGASGVICTGDWDQVFADISEAVVDGAQVSCELAIPPPPDGETLDPDRVNVRYLEGGVGPGVTLTRVDSAADCAAGGWYYDDNLAPTLIILCPSSCSDIQNDPAASLQVEFGCSTVVD